MKRLSVAQILTLYGEKAIKAHLKIIYYFTARVPKFLRISIISYLVSLNIAPASEAGTDPSGCTCDFQPLTIRRVARIVSNTLISSSNLQSAPNTEKRGRTELKTVFTSDSSGSRSLWNICGRLYKSDRWCRPVWVGSEQIDGDLFIESISRVDAVMKITMARQIGGVRSSR